MYRYTAGDVLMIQPQNIIESVNEFSKVISNINLSDWINIESNDKGIN